MTLTDRIQRTHGTFFWHVCKVNIGLLLSMKYLRLGCWTAIILIFIALHDVTNGAMSLHELGKENVKLYGITGKIRKGDNGSVNVEIEIGKTSTLRRGQVVLYLHSSDGTINLTWQVEPSHPLIVKFVIPQSVAKKSDLVLMMKELSDPDSELYDRGYCIELCGEFLFGAENPLKEQKVKRKPR
jgi:hypothetical protein